MKTTARAFLAAFEEGGDQDDPSLVNRDVTSDCTRHMLPASIYEAFGLPADFAFDTTQFQETFAKDLKVLKFKNNIMENLVIDTEARRVAFTSIAEVHPKAGEWFVAEQAWIVYLNDDGSKVQRVIEFCDKDAIMKMTNASA